MGTREPIKQGDMIEKYLNEKLILFFNPSDQGEAISTLVNLAVSAGVIQNSEPLLSKVKEREKIVSTGIGLSVAIPHAKLSDLTEFFIAIGILGHGIDWSAIDIHPVRLVFLIAGPDNQQNEYLQILSNLTTLLKNETFRKKLLTSNSPQAMINFFSSEKVNGAHHGFEN